MLQCEAIKKKSRNTAPCKSDVIQRRRNSDRWFSGCGTDAETSQTIPCMQINYRASEKPVKPVIQMNIANAQAFRATARHIAAGFNNLNVNRTVGVSNNMFAITPALRGNRQQATAQGRSGNRAYAGAVPGGNQAGNHAERKLIFHDGGLSEIGVDRTICPSCVNAICNNAANISHVSDPNGTYSVAANGLTWVAN